MQRTSYVRCVYIRDLLSLTVEEAAVHIGDADMREWINWESNRIAVPEYVIKRIDNIAIKHQNLINKLAVTDEPEAYHLGDYDSYEAYKADHPGETYLDWKIAQNISEYSLVLED